MNLWKTTTPCQLHKSPSKFRLYQGVTLFPLLCCIGLNTLSQLITASGYRNTFRSWMTICHLLYMDGIKLYARSKWDIDSLIYLIRIYSKDIRMSFGLNKCCCKDGKEREDDLDCLNFDSPSKSDSKQSVSFIIKACKQKILQPIAGAHKWCWLFCI